MLFRESPARAIQYAGRRPLPPLPLRARTRTDGQMRARLAIGFMLLAAAILSVPTCARVTPSLAGSANEATIGAIWILATFFVAVGAINHLVLLRATRRYTDPHEEYVVAEDRFVLRREGRTVLDRPWSDLALVEAEAFTRRTGGPMLASITLAAKSEAAQGERHRIEARAIRSDGKILDAIARKLLEADGVRLL